MSLVSQAATLVAFPVGAAVVGSTVATWKRPGPRLMSGVQHFAAGVVIAALVGEVLPDLRNEGNLTWAVGGFIVGVAVMLSLGAFERRQQARQETRNSSGLVRAAAYTLPISLLVVVGIDLLLDGLLVGLGVTLGSSAGLILTIALTIEILFLALSVVGELLDEGVPRARAATICILLGLVTAVGAIGGAAVLGGATPQVLAAVLAFGSVALLYLAVEELLVEAHEQQESTLLGAMFFAGFLLIYILGEVAA